MAYTLRTLIYISLLLAPLLTRAETTVAGIALADSYPLDGESLLLNGAGARSKLFVDVHIGALYLPERSRAAHQVLTTPGAKGMQILYKQMPAAKIAGGWRDGFRANPHQTAFGQLEQRLEDVNTLFPDLQRGEFVCTDDMPGQGTRLSVNGELRTHSEGEAFFRALMQVWIGGRPAHTALKQGLLGQD